MKVEYLNKLLKALVLLKLKGVMLTEGKHLTKHSMPKTKKKSKQTFRSGFEERIASQLRRNGIKYSYESLVIEYKKLSTYTPDFILPNGIIIETKGRWVTEDRTKHLLVKQQHPDLDIRLLFQNAYNKIRKGSKTTYAMWCEKKGILYAHKQIPKSWLSLVRISSVQSVDRVTLLESTQTEAQNVSAVIHTVEADNKL
uniref:Endodeoxyribonuclease n=1 Tax=uncultured marine virus TaxID=186617 RepID=A0A0F7LA21_9VIRU|nr:endodeoxyribonuclease [uncultured marine virus]